MKKLIRVIFPDKLDVPVGGLSIVASNLKKHLGKEYDLEFIGQPQGKEMEGYREAPFPLRIQHGALNSITGQLTYFAESVTGRKPDLIHAFDWSVFLSGVYASRHYGVPLVCSMQLSINALNSVGITYCADLNSADGHWINETHKQIELAGLENADKIIHVSEAYSERFGYKEKSVVAQNGVEPKELKGDKVNLPGENKLKVIYIGRFANMKSVDQLSKAQVPDNVDLIYIGKPDGGEQWVFDAMMRQVKEKPNVHYYGSAFGKEKANILTSADAVIFPSMHEPFGIVGLEAMASDCVLLTSRVDGIGDYANNKNSVYSGTDVKSIEFALQYFSEMGEKRREEYLKEGRKTVKQFSWEKSMEVYREVYDELT